MGSTKQTTATTTTSTRGRESVTERNEQVEQQVVQGEDGGEHEEVYGEPFRPARQQQCDNQPSWRPFSCRCWRFRHLSSLLPLYLVVRNVRRQRRQLPAEEEEINAQFLQGEILGIFLQESFGILQREILQGEILQREILQGEILDSFQIL